MRKSVVKEQPLAPSCRSSWGAYTSTLRTGALALVYSAAEYAAPAWSRSAQTKKLDVTLNETMRIITGCLCPTPVKHLSVLSGIYTVALRLPKTLKANAFALIVPLVDMQQLLNIPISTPRNNGKPTGKIQTNQLNQHHSRTRSSIRSALTSDRLKVHKWTSSTQTQNSGIATSAPRRFVVADHTKEERFNFADYYYYYMY